MAESSSKPVRRVVVVADLVGYSAMAGPVDEILGADGIAALDGRIRRIVDEALKEAGAEPFLRKGTGDGAILVFDHAEPAERFAVALHQGAVREDKSRGGLESRSFRVGIAAGEVLVSTDGEPSGFAISAAARLEARAPHGGMLIAATVWAELPEEVRRLYSAEENIAGKHEGEGFPARRRVVSKVDEPGLDEATGHREPPAPRSGGSRYDQQTQEPPVRDAPRTRGRPAVWLAVGLAAVVLGTMSVMVPRRLREPAVEVAERPAVLTVAVLGFAPPVPDPEAEWMAMALEEVLSTELRANRRILVPDGRWAAEIRRTAGPTGQLDEADLARLRADRAPALADTVVTGVWATTGDQLSVRLDLRDLETGKERTLDVTGNARDLAALARDAARKIEDDLELAAFSPADARASTELVPGEAETLKLYAKGLAAWRLGRAKEARLHLMAALEVEPAHPMLHLVHGEVLWYLGYTRKAADAASEALAQADRLARVPRLEVTARSHRLLGESDAALTALEELIAVDPDESAYRALRAEIWASSDKLAKDARAEALDDLAALRSEVRGVFKARAEMAEARLRLDAGEIELAKDLALQAVATGSSTGVISPQAHGRLLEAVAHELQGELKEARAALEEAQRLFQHLGNPRRERDVFLKMAIASAQTGELETALRMFEDYLGIFAKHGDPLNEAIVKLNLANVYIYLGELEKAETLVKATEDVFEDRGTLREIAQANVILGNIYYYMGRLVPTRENYEQALATFRSIGDRERIARSLANLGEVLILGGDLLEAESKYVAALTINRELGNRPSEAYDLFSLGQIAAQRDDPRKGREFFQDSQRLAEELDDPVLLGYIQRERAWLALVEDRVAEAERLAGEAVSTFRGFEMVDDAVLAQTLQAQAFLELETPDLARARELGTQIESHAAASQNRKVRFEAEMLAARLDAMGGTDAQEIVGPLEALAEKAETDGYVLDACAARLLLGEIEMQGALAEGRARLETLRSEAEARGLSLFARRAKSLSSKKAGRGS